MVEGRYQVLAQPLGWTRCLVFAGVAVALLLVLGVMGRGEPQCAVHSASAPISWTNPEISHVATIGPGWTHDVYYDGERRAPLRARRRPRRCPVSSIPAGALTL